MSEKKSPPDLLDVTSPIFTPEMGARLALARMRLLLDQKEFGERLGLSQQQLSRLEKGEKVFHGIPSAKFKAVLGDAFMFVMFGTGEHRFPPNHVKVTYWQARNSKKGNRTERYRFWEKKNA